MKLTAQQKEDRNAAIIQAAAEVGFDKMMTVQSDPAKRNQVNRWFATMHPAEAEYHLRAKLGLEDGAAQFQPTTRDPQRAYGRGSSARQYNERLEMRRQSERDAAMRKRYR